MLVNYDVISPSIYGKFGAVRKPDSRRIVCKTYISINSNLLSYQNCKTNTDINNIKKALVLKGILSETTYVYKLSYQISSF